MAPHTLELTSKNAHLLGNIAEDVFDHKVDPIQLRRFLDDPRHLMFIAVDGDQVVGQASGVEYYHPDKPPQLWINEVGVAPTHRRQGIGQALTKDLISAARERGCSAAWLGTGATNEAGRACFSSIQRSLSPQAFLLFEWDLRR